MKQRIIYFIFAVLLFSAPSWGQTWNLSPTMTATLDNGVLTISTSASSEAMPDYSTPWSDVRDDIKSVVIVDKVTTIGANAFQNCTNLISVVFSNTIVSIGSFAFENCFSLDLINLPSFLTSIGYGTFNNCPSLTSINIKNENQFFSTIDGVLFNKNATLLIAYPCGKTGNYIVPNSTTTIGEYAFRGSIVESVIMQEGILYILHDAFQSSELISVEIPKSVISIGTNTFVACYNLKNVTVHWDIPLSINEDVYYYKPGTVDYSANVSACTLHVPAGTESLYLKDPVWGTFGTIIEGEGGIVGGPPTCTLTEVTNLTAHSATLNARINPNGSNTAYMFQYSMNIGFPSLNTLSTDPVSIGSGTSAVTVSVPITGLTDNSSYYYRIVAMNPNGTTTTNHATFNTPFDIRLNAAMNIPASMTAGQTYSVSITVLNNSVEQFNGCFYLKDGDTNVLDWSNVIISSSGTHTLEKTYTPTTSGTKMLRLYHQINCNGSGTPVAAGSYSNPVTVTVGGSALAPSQPSNPTPGDNATEISITPVFSWNSSDPLGGQVFYTLLMGTIPNTFTPWANGTGTSTSGETITLQPGTTYYWRVESSNSQGKISIGPIWSFKTVEQTLPAPIFNISPKGTKDVESKSGAGIIQITSNISWNVSITSTGNWLRVSKTNGSGNDVISYNYDANNGSERKGTINVISNSATYSFIINQLGVSIEPYLILQEKEKTLNNTTGSGSFKVSSNISWKATAYSADNWLTLTSSSGNNDGSIVFNYGMNPFSTERTALILVDGGGLTRTYNVAQIGSAVSQTYQLRQRFPKNNATDMPRSTPKFDWEDSWVSNPRYELQIMGTLNGTVTKTVTSSEYQFDPAEGATLFEYNRSYSWRVREVSTTSPNCNWSETWQFTVSPNYPNGPILGHFNDAIIRRNDGSSDPDLSLQCVAYVKRYNAKVYGLSMAAIGDAKEYYRETQRLGFRQFENGSGSPPENGDIICLSGGSYGHVGIIREVGANYVNIAQQNVGANVDNHISQRVGLTVSNGRYTISNYLGSSYTLQGWRRAKPTVISPVQNQYYTTTDVLVRWLEHPALKGYNYKLQISTYNPQSRVYEGLAGYYEGPTAFYTFRGQANTQYRCRVSISTYNGEVETEPIYFSIGNVSTRSATNDENITRLHIKTMKQTSNGVVVATNIRVEEIYEGHIFCKGETNEEGLLNVEIAPALHAGSVLIVSGPGVVSKDMEITDEMLISGEAQVILQENDADKSIIDPKVEILNYQPVYKNREVQLKITATNHSAFQIIDYHNSSDTLTASTEYEPSDSLVSFILRDVGDNTLSVRFIGENEVWISKNLIFNPEIANLEMASVTLLADNSSMGAEVYLNGSFLKQITQTTEVLQVPPGFQNFTFVKENYATVFVTTQGDETIDLRMNYTGNMSVSQDEMQVIIYPNPVNDVFVLSINNNERGKIRVSIYNIIGHKIDEQTITSNTTRFDTSKYPAGIYCLRIITESGKSATKKIIKK